MKFNNNTPKREFFDGSHLEPRVVKLELGMERLTDDVRDLAQTVRTQGNQVEQEIQKLVVAVTQASGPKKTDWGTIIAGLALIMVVGSAIFWPLNQTSQESKVSINRIEQKHDDHVKVSNHPVGEALIQRLESRIFQLEDQYRIDSERYKDELSIWQQKAMGLSNHK